MIKRGFLRSTTHEPHQMAQAVPSAWCVPLSGVHPFDGHLCDTWWPSPPLWWPPCWRLLMLLHHLLLFSCLLITSNFALSLSQIVNNLLWRQANAKGLKMRQSHFLFFFGCRMQNILRCRKNSLQGRVVHKGWQDDHSLRVLWHPTPPATIANFRPWQPSIFSFELFSLSGGVMIFFFWRRPPKGGDVEIAFVERSHKSEAVPVLTWNN